MKIYTATHHFYSDVAHLFRNVGETKILPKNYQEETADILVFTGGGDICPNSYGYDNFNSHLYDTSRDSWELQIMEDILNKTFKVKKVIGFCRGLQLINVALGGDLTFDIQSSFGRSHEFSHSIVHKTSNMFEFLTTVNSLHHQAIRNLGGNIRGKVLAVHPNDNVPEIVHWGNRIFGTQFHPEFFPDDLEEKGKFVETVVDWVTGKSSFSRIIKQDNIGLNFVY